LSTLKVNSIQHSNGTDALTIDSTGNTSFSGVVTGTPLANRNLIINGDMRIAQRGTSVAGITGSNYYTCDRWRFLAASVGTWTQTQSTDVPTGQGFANSLKMECTTANALSAGSNGSIVTRLEGQNLQHLKKGTSNAESLTMSFWVKSNKTGTLTASLFDGDNTRWISKSYTIDTANTWEQKTLTFTGDITGAFDNDNGSSLHIYMWLMVGTDYTSGTLATSWESYTPANAVDSSQINLADSTSNYINITGVQLEVGDTATPFEHRPYDMELARCQRYFCSSFNAGVAPANGVVASVASIFSAYDNTTGWSAWIPLPVKMRTVPSMTAYRDSVAGTDGQWATYDSGYTTLSSTTLSPSGTDNGFYCNGSRSSAFAAHDTYLLRGNFTADAEL